MFVTKKLLPRRTFLRGAGAAIALTVTACDLDVSSPGVLDASSFDASVDARTLSMSAQQNFYDAYADVINASALYSGEVWTGAVRQESNDIARRAIVDTNIDLNGTFWAPLQLALATNDDDVQEKIDDIATKYDLEGYQTTDADRFWSFYLDSHLWLSLSLMALIILFVSIMFHTRMRLHRRPVGSAIAVTALAVLLFLHQQYGTVRSRAIIASTTTYLMDGPSAGASVLDIVGDGHRVEILGKKDVWLKIRWDEDVVYVKENAVKELRL